MAHQEQHILQLLLFDLRRHSVTASLRSLRVMVWVCAMLLQSRRQLSSIHVRAFSAPFFINRNIHHHLLSQLQHPPRSMPQNSFSCLFPKSSKARGWRFITPLPAGFQEGDTVVVVDRTGTDSGTGPSDQQRGIIQERRGGGWYTIRLEQEGKESFLKCRGSQLRHFAPQQSDNVVDKITEELQRPQSTSVLPLNYQSTTSETFQMPLENAPASALNLQQYPTLPPPTTTTPTQAAVFPPPPPPTIINLDVAVLEQQLAHDEVLFSRDRQYLQQVAHHASYSNQWVIFTDLHCSPSSLDTCLQVLQRVHQLAVQRNAGILFLGDWWHHRGTLRVDCVNAVLHELATWHVPMILIPGNHDQVTLGGYSHGLTVLENAYRVVCHHRHDSATTTAASTATSFPGPLVFSHPTLFNKALFIPHIRDNAIMESVLMSPEATKLANAVFCHVDVTGALMNDMVVSEGGVPPYFFPSHIPIYTGHFHKPHSLLRRKHDTPIEYLGSPYQTSLSEAHQDKSLVVVDVSQNWKCIERIPLDIGPRYWKVYSVPELFKLKPGAPIEEGDRVVLIVSRDNLEQHQQQQDAINGDTNHNVVSPLDEHVKTLRASGASVEIRHTKTLPLEALGKPKTEIEEMSPSSTLQSFLSTQLKRGALSNNTAESLLRAGLQILEELDEARGDTAASSSEGINSRQKFVDLHLHAVKIEGFGPFQNAVTYPLRDRGLVLLRGTNKDGGSDSNGSGKSSLAMAALWALTGSIDPRPTQDSKIIDIINDNSKAAKVSVNGELNGIPFTIMRTKTAKKGQLAFTLDGNELTRQSIKETQLVIDEKLGVSAEILARSIFHGQHTMNGLLESTDSKLKEELSLVVPLTIWQEAAALSRSKAREASKKASGLEGMLQLRTEDLGKLQGRQNRVKAELNRKIELLNSVEQQLQTELQRLSEERGGALSNSVDLDSLQMKLDAASEEAAVDLDKQEDLVKECDRELGRVRRKVVELNTKYDLARNAHQSCERDYDRAQLKVETFSDTLNSIEEKWGVELKSGNEPIDFRIPQTCPTCLQPIQFSGQGHSHDELKQVAESEIATANKNSRASLSALENEKARSKVALEALVDAKTKLASAQVELMAETSRRANMLRELNDNIAAKRSAQRLLSKEFTNAATVMQRLNKVKQLEVAVAAANDATVSIQEDFNAICEEFQETEAKVQELTSTCADYKKSSKLMLDLSDEFGPRGVQAFILHTAVEVLQTTSQTYLNELSDGSLRLQLSIDEGDRISRSAFVRTPNGEFTERPLASLSGGQWRRCSLALSLGFADLVATRGRMRSSLCVLDEPLTFLDTSGRVAVGRLLRSLLRRREQGGVDSARLSVSTILIILQDLAAEELEEAFDRIDEVVKEGGSTSVVVDEHI